MNHEHAHSHIVIPRGAPTLDPQADFRLDGTVGTGDERVERYLSQEQQILGCIVHAQMAAILAEIGIEPPMLPVFNPLTQLNRMGQINGTEFAESGVIALFHCRDTGPCWIQQHRLDFGDGLALVPISGIGNALGEQDPGGLD